MYKRIGKRFVAVLLIVIMMFSMSAPAFAYTVSTDPGVKTSFYYTAEQFEIAWDYFMENESLTDELIDAFDFKFVDFSTSSDADYIGYSMYEVNEWVKDLSRQGFHLADFMHWTYVPGTGYYIFCFQSEPLFFATRFGEAEEKVRDFCNLIGIDGLAFAAASFGQKPLTSPYMVGGSFGGGSGGSRGEIVGSAGTPHDYYTNQSDMQTTINSSNQTTNTSIYNGGDTYTTETFDYSNGTWYDNVTGTVNDIETLYYSPSNDTYTVNNTYNITYEYNYTYYYNLGSSENLVQDYKFYYELPDGRSSSDLTADEIMGLSLEFDVVNYAEDMTDENTKILVPFDGSWEDIAFQGPDLFWKAGPSISYRDSAAFEGALYLDGTISHAFGFSGFSDASFVMVDGMTVQFRYYLDGLTDSSDPMAFAFAPFTPYSSGQTYGAPYFYIYQNQLRFFQTNVMNSNKYTSGSLVCSIPTGEWVDLCFSIVPIATNEVEICVYLNGLLRNRQFCTIPVGSLTQTHYPYFGFNCSTFGSNTSLSSSFDDYWGGFQPSGGSPGGQPFQMIDNLRVVDFALYDNSVSQFIPTPVPFDTNLVYVLPDTSNLKDNTIAVQHGSTVTGYRIGGVRPTFPEEGMVWMPLEGDKIADCQIYNGSYWESVGCRIWTGERWVPAWAFNVVTLADLWDLYGGEDVDSYTEITSGSFYQWFQEQFLELKTIIQTGFDRIANALGVQTDDTDVTEPDENGNSVFTFFAFFDNLFSTDQTEEAGVVEDALDSLLALASRFISSIRDFFAGFAVMEALSTDYFAGIADTLSAASELVSGVWEAIPTPITDVLIACFMLIVFGVLIAIFV